jgi:hypothetical protein
MVKSLLFPNLIAGESTAELSIDEFLIDFQTFFFDFGGGWRGIVDDVTSGVLK